MKHQQLKTSPEISKRMAHVKTKKNSAEVMLAKSLWHRGYRYRLNYKALPGSPDIAGPRSAPAGTGKQWKGSYFRPEPGPPGCILPARRHREDHSCR